MTQATNPGDVGSILLVLGTRNMKKGAEMGRLLAPPWEPDPVLDRIRIETLDGYPEAPEVVEDAPDFAGNADKKAVEVARVLQRWVLADDSGLAVDALDGQPGVYSARYAGEPCDDAANNAKLLAELDSVADPARGAAFVCHLSLSDPSGTVRLRASGQCRGRIARGPRGDAGFGYDPLFIIPEYHRTFGELSPLVKSQLSHRARAFAHLRDALRPLIARGEME